MKQISTDFYSFTEIGGVGEMVYKAVRFPEYVPEYDHSRKEETIVPIFTFVGRPTADTDYSLTGQDLLASLCNLYKKVNAPDYSEGITEMVWNWCRKNIHPYDIDTLCEKIETADFMDAYFYDELTRYATFDVNDFVSDLCKLGTIFEYHYALTNVNCGNAEYGRELYYEGRVCDSMPFLERYRLIEDDTEYVNAVRADYVDLMRNVLEAFPDIKLRLKTNPKSQKIELGADVQSVFDIAWYAFARMVADIAPPHDEDMNHMYSSGSVLTCMACGDFFVRHGSRQRYCNNPNCKAERNKRKSKAYYDRKKQDNENLN